MKIYAARYTDCHREYGPAVISLHLTKEGAEKAVQKSKTISKQQFVEMQEWSKRFGDSWWSENTWSEEDGIGYERWAITEMEVEE